MLRRMDRHATAEQETLRASFRTWLMGAPPLALRRRIAAALRRPGRDGRLRAPVAGRAGGRRVGGPDLASGVRRPRTLGVVENYVVIEELARARAPELVIGIHLVGPTLLGHGTPEQKERFLPHILPAKEDDAGCSANPPIRQRLASLFTTKAIPVDGALLRLPGARYRPPTPVHPIEAVPDPLEQQRPSARSASPPSSSTCRTEDHPSSRWCSRPARAGFSRVDAGRGVHARRAAGRRGRQGVGTVGPVDPGPRTASTRGSSVVHAQLNPQPPPPWPRPTAGFDELASARRLAQAATEYGSSSSTISRSLTSFPRAAAGPRGRASNFCWSNRKRLPVGRRWSILQRPAVAGRDRNQANGPGSVSLAVLPASIHLRRQQRVPRTHDRRGRARPPRSRSGGWDMTNRPNVIVYEVEQRRWRPSPWNNCRRWPTPRTPPSSTSSNAAFDRPTPMTPYGS